jgi:fluoride exporter
MTGALAGGHGRGKAFSAAFRRRVTLLAVIGAGGAIGAAARYGTALAIPPRSGAYPVATFLVNVVGAVILGGVAALPAEWLRAHELTRPAIGTGFCGGLTTFSTMTLEIYQRSHGHSAVAVAYAVTSLLAAPACAWVGFSLVQRARNVSRERRAPHGPAKEQTKR